MARPAGAEYAAASAALHVADGCRRPLLARLRRIHPPDRRAHRGGLRPAVERHRRQRSGSIPQGRVLKAVATRDTWSGITLNWPVDGGEPLAGGIVGLADVRSARGILPAIAASGSAAISTAWRGLPRCAAMNCSAIRRPQALSADIVRPTSPPKSACFEAAPLDRPHYPHSHPETSQPTDLETAVEPHNQPGILGNAAGNAEERAAVSADQRERNRRC